RVSLLWRIGVVAGGLLAGVVIGAPSLLLNPVSVLSGNGTQMSLALNSNGFWGFQFSDWQTWRFYGVMLELAWGWPVLLLAVAGVVKALRRHESVDMIVLVFPATLVILLLSASAAASAFARYLVPILPFLAFYAADGAESAVTSLMRCQSVTSQRGALA